MENALFKLRSDLIEIAGSEKFVETQLENFRKMIESSYEKILNPAVDVHGPKTVQGPALVKKDLIVTSTLENKEYSDFIEVKQQNAVGYENVFVMDGEKFQLLCDLPSNSISGRMIDVVLIYMWAQQNRGVETIPFAELRDICMNAGEFDSSNFSKAMDNNKKYFLLLGDGKSRTAKLIRPGIKEAERLITQLNKHSL